MKATEDQINKTQNVSQNPNENPNIKLISFLLLLKKPNAYETINEIISNLFITEFDERFPNVLIESAEIYLKTLTKRVVRLLEDLYSEECFTYTNDKIDNNSPDKKINLHDMIKKHEEVIKKEYFQPNYKILSANLTIYEKKFLKSRGKSQTKNIEIIPYLRNYRKHCKHTNEAIHICGEKIVEILNDDNQVTHLLCIKCKKGYMTYCVNLFCNACDLEYYSCYIPEDNDSDFNVQPATWEKYHCGAIINDKMRCIQCKDVFYLNCESGKLVCLNIKCKLLADPMNIQWTCVICKEEFKSEAKVYNPLEFKNIKNAIKDTIINKTKAKPQMVPCCSKINNAIESTSFFHKKECGGELYTGELNGKEIVVCEKCRTMNFYDKYIWTCPVCQKRFRQKTKVSEESNQTKERSYSNLLTEDLSTPSKNSDQENGREERVIKRQLSQLVVYEQTDFGNVNRNRELANKNYSANQETKVNKTEVKNSHSSLSSQSLQSLLNSQDLQLLPPKPTPSTSQKVIKFKSIINSNSLNPELINKSSNVPPSISSSTSLAGSSKNITCNNNLSNCNNININLNINFKKSLMEDFNKAISEQNEEVKPVIENKEKISNMNLINLFNISNTFNAGNGNATSKNNSNNNINYNISPKRSVLIVNNTNSKSPITKLKLDLKRNDLNISRSIEEIMSSYSPIKKQPVSVSVPVSKNSILALSIDEYNILKQIGEGSYGKIYLVEHKKSKDLFAMKKIIAHSKKEVDEFQNEYELMNSMIEEGVFCKDYILKILKVCVKELDATTNALYVLMELADSDWEKDINIRTKLRKYYTEDELMTILSRLIKALSEMQKENISHRDIKPQNILIFNNKNNNNNNNTSSAYKLADFGEAKEMKQSKQQQMLSTLRGTELYMSPLLFVSLQKANQNLKEDYKTCKITHNTFKSDVFSLGYCLLLAASLSFRSLYDVRELQDMKRVNAVINKYLNGRYTSKFINLIIKMVETNESIRPDFISLEKSL